MPAQPGGLTDTFVTTMRERNLLKMSTASLGGVLSLCVITSRAKPPTKGRRHDWRKNFVRPVISLTGTDLRPQAYPFLAQPQDYEPRLYSVVRRHREMPYVFRTVSLTRRTNDCASCLLLPQKGIPMRPGCIRRPH